MSGFGFVRAMNAVSVQQPGAGLGKVDVPDLISLFLHRDVRSFLVIVRPGK
jgi:hypothetical protein